MHADLQPAHHEDGTNPRPLDPDHCSQFIALAHTVLLKLHFWPQKFPFKTSLDAKFKHIINYIKMVLWPGPHSNVLPYHS